MAKRTFQVKGQIVDRKTGRGMAGFRVEVWDKDLLVDDLIGSVVTDSEGAFQLAFDASRFAELFQDRRPDLFFKVYRRNDLVRDTQDSILWNTEVGETTVVIKVDEPAPSPPFIWGGEQTFQLVGTGRHEDTLRVESNHVKTEQPLRLTLPTLCITYADMAFTNAIGGKQENYPASSAYGPTYFDPPVEILGEEKVEKLTWIRGAHRVRIGREKTEVEWYPWNHLVIPRLRLDQKGPTTAALTVKDVPIAVDRELAIKVMQYADGRHIGGIRVEKRHPDWRPKGEKGEYDLWIRVIDGETLAPMPEVVLNLFRWDPKLATPHGSGGFSLVEQRYTDGSGAIHDPARPSGELEAVTIHLPGWRATARCFRPLPGQRVQFHMRAWRLKEDVVPYTWQASDDLESMGLLTGHSPEDIVSYNRLAGPSSLKAGMRISLPCYAATYRMDPGDTYEWLAEAFAYAGVEELAKLNGLGDPSRLDGGADTLLPGWHFFYARRGDSLVKIDELFGLPPGWSRTVGRVHHPDGRLPYASETIAVPTAGFAETHSVENTIT